MDDLISFETRKVSESPDARTAEPIQPHQPLTRTASYQALGAHIGEALRASYLNERSMCCVRRSRPKTRRHPCPPHIESSRAVAVMTAMAHEAEALSRFSVRVDAIPASSFVPQMRTPPQWSPIGALATLLR